MDSLPTLDEQGPHSRGNGLVNIGYMESFCSGIVSTFRLSFEICFIRILPKQLKFDGDEKHGIGSIRKNQLIVSAIFYWGGHFPLASPTPFMG